MFRTPELAEHTFGMEFDLGGQRAVVQRSGRAPSKFVVSGKTEHSPESPQKQDSRTGDSVISNESLEDRAGAVDVHPGRRRRGRRPQVRADLSLAFLLLRSAPVGRWVCRTTQQSSKQQPWDQQVAISFLLGLDWTIPQAWQTVREREKVIDTLRKVASQGALGELIGTAADLRTQLTVAEQRCKQLRERVAPVPCSCPSTRITSREASDLTRQLNDLANDNALDRQLLAELERAVHAEAPPPVADLEHLYEEVGIALPGVAVRRFDEVRQFHESVVANRRSYLAEEIDDTRRRIAVREQQKDQKDGRRAEVMNVLHTHGALEQYSLLSGRSQPTGSGDGIASPALRDRRADGERQDRVGDRTRQAAHPPAPRLPRTGGAAQGGDPGLRGDFQFAVREAGQPHDQPEPNGPKFEVKIHAAKSKGISNMQIFCFDMMLTLLCAERNIGPGSLVHDSHLFDGVDERQVAKALEIGGQTTTRLGWQYIVTLNSDALPATFENHAGVVQPNLTDATEDGGLFGLRFG